MGLRELAMKSRRVEKKFCLDLIPGSFAGQHARVEQHPIDDEGLAGVEHVAGDPGHGFARRGPAQAGDGDVRLKLAVLTIDAEVVDDPRAALVKQTDGVGLGDADPQGSRLAAGWEHAGAAQLHGEGRRLQLAEGGDEPAHAAAVDFVEEVQGQVELIDLLPAGTGDAAGEQLQIEVDGVGQFEAQEQTWHGAIDVEGRGEPETADGV